MLKISIKVDAQLYQTLPEGEFKDQVTDALVDASDKAMEMNAQKMRRLAEEREQLDNLRAIVQMDWFRKNDR